MTDVPAVLSDCGAMLSVGLLVVLNVYKKNPVSHFLTEPYVLTCSLMHFKVVSVF